MGRRGERERGWDGQHGQADDGDDCHHPRRGRGIVDNRPR
jgi:hypothetical protein